MSTSSQSPAVIARYALTPGVGAGPLRFGDRVVDHPELVPRRVELDYPVDVDGDFAEYAIPGLDDVLVVYVDGEGRIDSIGFYEFCRLESSDLIGMGVGELLVRLGLPSTIEAEQIGREVELLYAYESLGLTVWTIDGEVCVVVAGAAEQ